MVKPRWLFLRTFQGKIKHNAEKIPCIDPSQQVPVPHPPDMNESQGQGERRAKKSKNPNGSIVT